MRVRTRSVKIMRVGGNFSIYFVLCTVYGAPTKWYFPLEKKKWHIKIEIIQFYSHLYCCCYLYSYFFFFCASEARASLKQFWLTDFCCCLFSCVRQFFMLLFYFGYEKCLKGLHNSVCSNCINSWDRTRHILQLQYGFLLD